jgi:hypothetical protein
VQSDGAPPTIVGENRRLKAQLLELQAGGGALLGKL